MKINLTLAMPIAIPFVLLGLARALWLLAGAEWNDPEFAAAASLFFGFPAGAIMAAILESEGVRWYVTIGRRK